MSMVLLGKSLSILTIVTIGLISLVWISQPKQPIDDPNRPTGFGMISNLFKRQGLTEVASGGTLTIPEVNLAAGELGKLVFMITTPEGREVGSVEMYAEVTDPSILKNAQDPGSYILGEKFAGWIPILSQVTGNQIKMAYYCNPAGNSGCRFYTGNGEADPFVTIDIIGSDAGVPVQINFQDEPESDQRNKIGALNPVENILTKTENGLVNPK